MAEILTGIVYDYAAIYEAAAIELDDELAAAAGLTEVETNNTENSVYNLNDILDAVLND